MKSDLIKLRLRNFGDDLLDMIFNKPTIMNKFAKSTAKFWLYQNIGKIEPYITAFEDKDGEIDTTTLMLIYNETLFDNDKLTVDLNDYLPDNAMLRSLLPNQIVITKDDLQKILSETI